MKTIFIGPLGRGSAPLCGASVKNYQIVNVLSQTITDLKTIDTEQYRSSVCVFISTFVSLFVTILMNPKAKYIISTSYGSANSMIRVLQKLCPKAQIVYWVIGGYVDKLIKNGSIDSEPYKKLSHIIVEGESMKNNLNSAGINNVSVLPNFKSIIKAVQTPHSDGKIRFVFLSRIMPEKGVNLILQAVRKMNESGYGDLFTVDFYGPMEVTYKDSFDSQINSLENANYHGVLELWKPENYKVLSSYDVMLFPTYWVTEGCPGVIIDAYMSGLPVIASDWNLNADYVRDKITGIIIEPNNANALVDAMVECIKNDNNINVLKRNVLVEAQKYSLENVLSVENLRRISVI